MFYKKVHKGSFCYSEELRWIIIQAKDGCQNKAMRKSKQQKKAGGSKEPPAYDKTSVERRSPDAF